MMVDTILKQVKGGAVMANFKKGDDLDKAFTKLFKEAEVFAKKEIAKIKK